MIFNLPKRISLILLSFIFISSCDIKEKEAAFKAKHGREPASDSEIDEVYGAGAATAAMDEVYEKMKKKK